MATRVRRALQVAIAVIAVGVTGLVSAPPSGAQPSIVADPRKSACEFPEEDTIVACDPRGGARRITLTLGAQRTSQHSASGVASIGGYEPLQEGETVSVDWSHPSSHATLYLWTTTANDSRLVGIALWWRAEHVEVTKLGDGRLEVRSPGRSFIYPMPRARPTDSAFWQPRSAREAAKRILSETDRLVGSFNALSTLCGALHPSVFAGFGSASQRRDVFYEEFNDWLPFTWCELRMFYVVHGRGIYAETAPTRPPRSTRHLGWSIAIHGDRATIATTIVHTFDRYERHGAIRRVVRRARILLAKDDQGVWRLAAFDALLPLVAFRGRVGPYDDAALASEYRRNQRQAARQQAAYDEQRAADALVVASPPCEVTTTPDAANDVAIGSTEDTPKLSRNQIGNGDIDLIATGTSGGCAIVQTRDPLPARFSVEVGNYDITVDNGSIGVIESYDGAPPTYGVVASLSDRELVLLLPKPPVPHFEGEPIEFETHKIDRQSRYYDLGTDA